MGIEVLQCVERENGGLLARDDDGQVDLVVIRYRSPAIRGIIVGTRHPAVSDVHGQARLKSLGLGWAFLAQACSKHEPGPEPKPGAGLGQFGSGPGFMGRKRCIK